MDGASDGDRAPITIAPTPANQQDPFPLQELREIRRLLADALAADH